MNFRMKKFSIIFYELPEREKREEMLLEDIMAKVLKIITITSYFCCCILCMWTGVYILCTCVCTL